MRIISIVIGEHGFTVELSDGQRIEISYKLYPRLGYAFPEELKHYRLIGDGEGIHWENLDEDISLENILSGEGSHESRKSLRKWLASRNLLTAGM